MGADGSILADGNQVAQLQVVDFAPGTQLNKVGNGMFTAPNGVTPQRTNSAQLFQGHIEGSNVDMSESMVATMSLVRAYESNQKLLQMQDETSTRLSTTWGRYDCRESRHASRAVATRDPLMEASQRIAVTGMLANQRALEVVSNNLANANTTGFKRAVAHTTDVGYQAGLTAPVAPGGLDMHLVGIGQGTQLGDISAEFQPGNVQPTGNLLDIALQGDGFFQISFPDGSTGYTRDGNFSHDESGRLVTGGGLPVQDDSGNDLVIPQDATNPHLDDLGQLMATDTTGVDQLVGSLGIPQFTNNAGLQANGQNLFTAIAASGPATPVSQGTSGAPTVLSGALEGSNVDMADEFTRLIQAQRGYQFNAKVVQSWDEIEHAANNLRGA